MQGHRNRLGRVWLQHEIWAIDPSAAVPIFAIGRKLLRDQAAQVSSCPARFHEKRMDICQRLDTSLDCLFKTGGRVGVRKLHSRLNSRQYVPGAVLGLSSENSDLRR